MRKKISHQNLIVMHRRGGTAPHPAGPIWLRSDGPWNPVAKAGHLGRRLRLARVGPALRNKCLTPSGATKRFLRRCGEHQRWGSSQLQFKPSDGNHHPKWLGRFLRHPHRKNGPTSKSKNLPQLMMQAVQTSLFASSVTSKPSKLTAFCEVHVPFSRCVSCSVTPPT